MANFQLGWRHAFFFLAFCSTVFLWEHFFRINDKENESRILAFRPSAIMEFTLENICLPFWRGVGVACAQIFLLGEHIYDFLDKYLELKEFNKTAGILGDRLFLLGVSWSTAVMEFGAQLYFAKYKELLYFSIMVAVLVAIGLFIKYEKHLTEWWVENDAKSSEMLTRVEEEMAEERSKEIAERLRRVKAKKKKTVKPVHVQSEPDDGEMVDSTQVSPLPHDHDVGLDEKRSKEE